MDLSPFHDVNLWLRSTILPMRLTVLLGLLIVTCRLQTEPVEPTVGDISGGTTPRQRSIRSSILLDLLKTPPGDHPQMRALIAPPRTIRLGPPDDQYLSYIGTHEYKLKPAAPKDVPAILQRLQRLEETGIWGYRTIDSWRSKSLPRASFVRAVQLDRHGFDGYVINMENMYSLTDVKTKKMILGERSWASALGDYDGGVAWFVFDITVTGRGIPADQPDSTAMPLAIRVGSRVFLAVDEYDREGRAPGNVIGDFDTDDISVERASRQRASDHFLDSASKFYLHAVADELKQPPFQAILDHETPNVIMLGRIGAKTDLLDGEYETTGYMVNAYPTGDGVRLYIHINVLAASHPANRPADPTPAQFQRYKAEINNARARALAHTCSRLGGTMQFEKCVLR